MEKTIRVSILGRVYPLRVEEADELFTRRVASLVDERARAMERQAPGHPDLTHLVIAALSLAEELIATQDQLDDALRTLEAAAPGDDTIDRLAADADALADRLDAALGAPGAGDGAARPAGIEPERRDAVPNDTDAGREDGARNREHSAAQGAGDEETGAASTNPETP
jgi:cell division protein ZapA